MSGNVPGVIGTGIRQFSGILSVVDISGNNLGFFGSGGLFLGNLSYPLTITFGGTTVVQGTTSSSVALNSTLAPSGQRYTLIRCSNSTPTFAISSAADGSSVPVENLLSGSRNATAWLALNVGDANLSSFGVNFNTTGTTAFTGPVQISGGLNSLQGTVTAPSATPVNLAVINVVPAFSVYLVSVTLPASQDAVHYNVVALVTTCGPSVVSTTLQPSSGGFMVVGAVFSSNTLLIQATQSSGNPGSIQFSILRLV